MAAELGAVIECDGTALFLFEGAQHVGTLSDETEMAALDSTHIKAHRCAGGGKKGLLVKPSA